MSAILAAGAVNAGAGLAGDLTTNIFNAVQAEKTREFNREEAQKNRDFQREMAQNNIKYAIQQANELGISPSLILGDQTNSLGGSQASVSGGQASFNPSGISSATNTLVNAITEQNKLKMMEEMKEDEIQAMKEVQMMKIANSTNNYENYIKRSGYNNKEEFEKSIYNDFSQI